MCSGLLGNGALPDTDPPFKRLIVIYMVFVSLVPNHQTSSFVKKRSRCRKYAGFLPWFHIVNTTVHAHVRDSFVLNSRLVDAAHFSWSRWEILLLSAGTWATSKNIGRASIG